MGSKRLRDSIDAPYPVFEAIVRAHRVLVLTRFTMDKEFQEAQHVPYPGVYQFKATSGVGVPRLVSRLVSATITFGVHSQFR